MIKLKISKTKYNGINYSYQMTVSKDRLAPLEGRCTLVSGTINK